MYKAQKFSSAGGWMVGTFNEYVKWLDKIQKEKSIEIIAVTSIEADLIVTYREL